MNHLYNFLKLIPSDKVISYKQLGEIFNLHPRKIAKILKENQLQDIYPCYKVINSNFQLGGYNLGIQEKIKRLEKQGIKIHNEKIDKKHLWNPLFKNFFCAFPLEGKEVKKFQYMLEELQKINNGSFSLQKASSPHITLRFFGNISLKDFHKIIEKTNKIKISGKKYITFNKIGNFGQKVYFFQPNDKKNLFQIYQYFEQVNNFKKETRLYQPHLTIARIKDPEKFEKIKKEFEELASNYSFYIKLNKIRFYLAVDNYFQIPIKDVSINF